jgi:hypothetical protein
VGDFGHQRASNKAPERARLIEAIHDWFDHYVRGGAPAPALGVEAFTQTCPRSAPSGGPFVAPSFSTLADGEVRYSSNARQAIVSGGGDPSVGLAIDPAAGGGDACAQTAANDAPGTASYRLPPAPAAGYTLLGAPTIAARLEVSGEPSVTQVAARLWDVAPDGRSQTLVGRGLYRPSGGPTDVFQLHPNGWTFAAGHVPRLELLAADPPYGRVSNQPFQIQVEGLELRLPVRERPDCRVVLPAAAPLRPPDQALAPGVAASRARGCGSGAGPSPPPRMRLQARCTPAGVRATAIVRGSSARHVDFYANGRRAGRDRRAPFSRVVARRARRRGSLRVSALAVLPDGGSVRRAQTVPACDQARRPQFTG